VRPHHEGKGTTLAIGCVVGVLVRVGDGVMVVNESGSWMGMGLGGGTSDSDAAGGSDGM
jgi:hypothetical protein